jgi:diadenosine tetraphosphate (Ap4A) HIT family hydrolase
VRVGGHLAGEHLEVARPDGGAERERIAGIEADDWRPERQATKKSVRRRSELVYKVRESVCPRVEGLSKGEAMARINPDPYAGGHLFPLLNRVTALLDSEAEVMAAVPALEEAGVATDDIDLFTGEQGARCLDLSGREHSRTLRLLRTLEAAVGDEAETNGRIDEALRRGATLVCVKAHKGKGDEKARALRVLRALHGREIHYWGPWAFEDMASATPCALCALPAERILGENEDAVWILDGHPVSPGHSLIVLKRHVESFFETTPAEREAMLSLLDRAREHAGRNHAPSGYNIGINDGTAAGQIVPHLHVHLIPRFAGDSEDPGGGVRRVIPEKAQYWRSARS